MQPTPPTRITFLLFDGVTALDFIGPAAAFTGPQFQIEYVAASRDPVVDDCGLGLVPTATFADIQHTDILCVPGTANPYAQIKKTAMIDWVAQIGATASWVTSVCTGSFILGAAGLLRGHRATAHWAMHHDLAYFGAIPTQARVVQDGNRITGAGITSGIDFGLTLLALISGAEAAQTQQLLMEYDPAPPFHSGSVQSADPALVSHARQAFTCWLKQAAPDAQATLVAAAARLGIALTADAQPL